MIKMSKEITPYVKNITNLLLQFSEFYDVNELSEKEKAHFLNCTEEISEVINKYYFK